MINNSTNPIFVWHGACEAPFSVTFDTHVLVSTNNIFCTLPMIEQKLNPGEKITATSPYLDLVYKATEAGTISYNPFYNGVGGPYSGDGGIGSGATLEEMLKLAREKVQIASQNPHLGSGAPFFTGSTPEFF